MSVGLRVRHVMLDLVFSRVETNKARRVYIGS